MISGCVKSAMDCKEPQDENINDNKLASRCGSKEENPYFALKTYFQEWHGKIIYAVEFCNNLNDGEPMIFATCGSNVVSIYECPNDNDTIELLQCYNDPSPTEIYYTLAWSYDPNNFKPILAVAGHDQIIRIINPTTQTFKKHLIGHGFAINDLKFHPKNPSLLLSASKDFSVRLWNIQTDICIAIFHGINGHQSDVLSADFDGTGSRIATCGHDCAVKIWKLNKPSIEEAIQASFNGHHGYKVVVEHYPEYSVDNIHTKYIDCVKWMGNLILSKSNENSIICWKPGTLEENVLGNDSTVASVIHEFKYTGNEFFFIRFSLDTRMTYMAVGNERGTTFLWKINENEPSKAVHLMHSKCKSTVRATSFSRDSKTLITVCDDGSVWKWNRVSEKC